jgi:AsmA protein
VPARLVDVTIALIDAKGCPEAQQNIRGIFLKPEVDQIAVVGALTESTRHLLRQARCLFGGKCDVLYAGSVAPPK